MTTEAIGALPIAAISQANAVLFLWATAFKLEDALIVMKTWGFAYRTHAIWDKEVRGLRYWYWGRHELLLTDVRGQFSPPLPARRIPSVYRERRTEHSRKPTYFREYLERAYPTLPKVELFCRDPAPGWAVWGNQLQP